MLVTEEQNVWSPTQTDSSQGSQKQSLLVNCHCLLTEYFIKQLHLEAQCLFSSLSSRFVIKLHYDSWYLKMLYIVLASSLLSVFSFHFLIPHMTESVTSHRFAILRISSRVDVIKSTLAEWLELQCSKIIWRGALNHQTGSRKREFYHLQKLLPIFLFF